MFAFFLQSAQCSNEIFLLGFRSHEGWLAWGSMFSVVSAQVDIASESLRGEGESWLRSAQR